MRALVEYLGDVEAEKKIDDYDENGNPISYANNYYMTTDEYKSLDNLSGA